MTADWRALCVEPLAQEAYVAFVQICKGGSDDAGTYDADEATVRRALKRLNELEAAAVAEPEPEGPTLQPVPVSERLPGPGDCDAKGRCWIGRPEYTFPMGDTGSWGHADPEWCLEKPCEAANSTAVWLPAHALPVPADD